MAVRCKFRSSMNFDSVDIDGRPSISIRDLKSKIVHNKKLDICQDFDLVLSDALTSQEYDDENFQILSGSSVIIKRVPARSVPLDMTLYGSFANFATKDSKEVKTAHPMIEEINFDDFGVDLCPAPEGTLSLSDIDVDKKIYIGENIGAARHSEPPKMGNQKLEASNPSEFIPRGPVHSRIEENYLGTKSKPDVQQCMKLEKEINSNPPAMQNANFPSELKCSLCNTLFKEAVMIPCCQHSFCEKCIRLVLVEKARCPKCFSAKCRPEDLLPNVSLRQAIEHFLESQILISGLENAFLQNAPDGESGNQAKDMSCAVTDLQREPGLPDSPTATGRGSNQIVAESASDSLLRNNMLAQIVHLRGGELDISLKSCTLPHKMKEIDGQRRGSAHLLDFKSRPADLGDFADCHGESQTIYGEAEFSNKKKRGLWVNTSGADRSFMESGRNKKPDRTCYMCGSPNHLIRDCPGALSPNPMVQPGNSILPGAMPGYAPHYWNGPLLSSFRPFTSTRGNPGMVPFNAMMASGTPFVGATYMPSVFGRLPAYGGYMRLGGSRTPVGINVDHLPRGLDHQECEKKRKISNTNMRDESSDSDEGDNVTIKSYSGKAERLHNPKSHFSKERSVSYSEDSFTHRSHQRHRRDRNLDDNKRSVDDKYEKDSRSSIASRERKPYHHQDRLSSEVEDMPCSSFWHGDERRKKRSRNSKKHHERREHFLSDCSWNCHPSTNVQDVERKRLASDVKRHSQKHDSHSDSGLEPSASSDRRKKHREKDLRHSRHNSKSMDNELSHDRWLMVKCSNEDSGEDHRYNIQKRVY